MANQIWKYDRGTYKVYVEDIDLMRRISGWGRCILHGWYYYPDGTTAWDFIFPGRMYNRIAQLVGLLVKEKNSKRVANGLRLGRKAIEDDHLSLR